MKKAKKAVDLAGLTGVEKKVARLRAAGMSFRKIEEKLGTPRGDGGNGSWALRVARRIGAA